MLPRAEPVTSPRIGAARGLIEPPLAVFSFPIGSSTEDRQCIIKVLYLLMDSRTLDTVDEANVVDRARAALARHGERALGVLKIPLLHGGIARTAVNQNKGVRLHGCTKPCGEIHL